MQNFKEMGYCDKLSIKLLGHWGINCRQSTIDILTEILINNGGANQKVRTLAWKLLCKLSKREAFLGVPAILKFCDQAIAEVG